MSVVALTADPTMLGWTLNKWPRSKFFTGPLKRRKRMQRAWNPVMWWCVAKVMVSGSCNHYQINRVRLRSGTGLNVLTPSQPTKACIWTIVNLKKLLCSGEGIMFWRFSGVTLNWLSPRVLLALATVRRGSITVVKTLNVSNRLFWDSAASEVILENKNA